MMRLVKTSLAVLLLGLALGSLARAKAKSPFSTAAPVSSINPGVVEIPSPETFSKVYAISDVHGMYDHLIPLLKNAGIIDSSLNWTAGNALLVVVGDSIDKGPKSIEVLDLWMALANQATSAHGRILHLLGNHEAEFLADPEHDKKAKELLAELESKGLKPSELTDPSRPRGAFLRSEPAAAQIGNWLFCHAGFLNQGSFAEMAQTARSLLAAGTYGDDFFIGPDSLLEAKKWWESDSDTRAEMEATLDQGGLFGVVFGHQPLALNVEGAIAQSDDSRLIKIDTGMAPQAGAHPGGLLVFENPAEMKLLRAPRVSVVRPETAVRQLPQSEVTGPALPESGD